MVTRLSNYTFHISATILLIVLSFYLNALLQTVLSLGLIFTVGIVHGANDLQLIQKHVGYSRPVFWQALAIYIGVVFLGIFIFYFFPSFGLLAFVLFSAFHFGEQHYGRYFDPSIGSVYKTLVFVSYGLAIFGGLFYFQWTEVHQVIFTIARVFVPPHLMGGIFLVGLSAFMLLCVWLPSLRKGLLAELMVLLLLFFLFHATNLLFAFAVYFIFWHSWPSMQDQMRFLYPHASNALWLYLKSSFPYWLLSVIGLVLIYLFFDIKAAHFLPLFFSFLAAITFPHTVVMGWLKVSSHTPDRKANEVSSSF